ncbi:MAG TPA: type VI secretion system tube protein TssD [Polyangiaceae bacterium]|nr:type VI secretion system tube protein TssD [Polyangiaceae bacterium]
MTLRRFASTAVAVLTCSALSSFAWADSAYMKVQGDKSGNISGGVVLKGHENTIEVIAVDHSIVTPTDAATGMATGKRQHKPFVITKLLDRSSPLLHQAQMTNENLKEVDLDFVSSARTSASSSSYYRIILKNARITSVRLVMPNNKQADTSTLGTYEEVSFSYQSITWTWIDGGITSTDDANVAR